MPNDSDVADHGMQIACRLSSRLVVVSSLDEVGDDLADLLVSLADAAV